MLLHLPTMRGTAPNQVQLHTTGEELTEWGSAPCCRGGVEMTCGVSGTAGVGGLRCDFFPA